MLRAACETLCASKQASMLCIEDITENNLLSTSHPAATVWMGINDFATEGTYVWPAGCTSTFVANWRGSEPNNVGNEDCISAYRINTGKWLDMNCGGASSGCACEIPHLQVSDRSCPYGWTVASDGSCYQFGVTAVTRDACAASPNPICTA